MIRLKPWACTQFILKDAKYDLTTNVSVVDGMTNGAECIIKKITE